MLDSQLEYEVTRYVFGRDVEAMRQTADDVQVMRALALLDDTPTIEELFARAAQESGAEGDEQNQ
jgi:hypothetical protein